MLVVSSFPRHSLRSHQIFTCAPCPSFVWGRPVDSAKEKRVSARKRGTERPRNERAKLGLQAAGGRARGRRRTGGDGKKLAREEERRLPPSLPPSHPPPSSSIPPHSTHSHLPFNTRLSSVTSFKRCEHCEGAKTRLQNGSSSRLRVRN